MYLAVSKSHATIYVEITQDVIILTGLLINSSAFNWLTIITVSPDDT